jgi:hypothetical protein
MSGLLIHSISEFSELVLGVLELAGARHVVEIGAEYGGMSERMAEQLALREGRLTSIDPSPKPEFLAWAAGNAHVDHVAKPSLEAIPTLGDVDAWVIDGDHNYYTVLHELCGAAALSKRDGKPFLAVLHDVAWPCARRDFYYAPDRIPPEWRWPYSFDGGVLLDDPGIHDGRGFRGAGHFAWALREGGPRNGVLTAVEDFRKASQADDRQLAWAFVPAVFGLGILFDAGAPWAADVAQLVLPYHDNRLLASLERNRLLNYLAVIDWQDRQASADAPSRAAA